MVSAPPPLGFGFGGKVIVRRAQHPATIGVAILDLEEEAEKERKKAVINNLSGTIRAPHPCINLHS